MEKLIVKNLSPVGNLTSTLSTSTGLVQIPGPKGEPGDSAYESWLALGNTGTEADFIASLEGPQGEPGVYIGSTEPSDEYDVWINPTASPDVVITAEQVKALINEALSEVENGTY